MVQPVRSRSENVAVVCVCRLVWWLNINVEARLTMHALIVRQPSTSPRTIRRRRTQLRCHHVHRNSSNTRLSAVTTAAGVRTQTEPHRSPSPRSATPPKKIPCSTMHTSAMSAHAVLIPTAQVQHVRCWSHVPRPESKTQASSQYLVSGDPEP